MDTYSAIMTRRMVAKMDDRVPERDDIEALLRAGIRAPSHHLTQPWRFIVLKGKALDDLGEAMASRVLRESPDDPNLDQKMDLERGRPHRAPTIIVVVYVPSANPKAIEVEDRYSVGAAVQNILLAAHDKGLGAYWRTGPAAYDRSIAGHLGLAGGEEIAGFVYLGYAQETLTETQRDDVDSRSQWLGF